MRTSDKDCTRARASTPEVSAIKSDVPGEYMPKQRGEDELASAPEARTNRTGARSRARADRSAAPGRTASVAWRWQTPRDRRWDLIHIMVLGAYASALCSSIDAPSPRSSEDGIEGPVPSVSSPASSSRPLHLRTRARAPWSYSPSPLNVGPAQAPAADERVPLPRIRRLHWSHGYLPASARPIRVRPLPPQIPPLQKLVP
ncbi:hypothetical protein WOLCODRAFT_167636 [Wolfiporia cocos MD-104 SS10]|uniref:Uncharacterized protein n=1 Tax=Wolfiporia cocos (strain MD-104) TaxID=742152 RepID=A0A2H3J9D6_WOLCO|nr:hypothetical protein WOLCODRAFT_167636 [Wolfiporia cocos MD-104 SS10]